MENFMNTFSRIHFLKLSICAALSCAQAYAMFSSMMDDDLENDGTIVNPSQPRSSKRFKQAGEESQQINIEPQDLDVHSTKRSKIGESHHTTKAETLTQYINHSKATRRNAEPSSSSSSSAAYPAMPIRPTPPRRQSIAEYLGIETPSDDSVSKNIEALEKKGFDFMAEKELNLAYGFNLTDKTLLLAAKKFKNLEILNVEWCKITDRGLSAIIENNHKLRHINIKFCREITDAGLALIVRNCPEIESINLSYCPHITEPGIINLIGVCEKLTSLNYEGTACEYSVKQIKQFLSQEPSQWVRDLEVDAENSHI